MKWHSIIFLLITSCLLQDTYAQTPNVALFSKNSQYMVGQEAFVYEDKEGRMTFEQIREQDALFRPNTGNIVNFSYTRSSVWVKFTVNNSSGEKAYVQVLTPSIDSLFFYAVSNTGAVTQLLTGAMHPYASKSLELGFHNFEIPSGISQVYLCARSEEAIQIPIRIVSGSELVALTHKHDIINGLFVGMIFFMFLYSSMAWFATRELLYLYYLPLMGVIGYSLLRVNGYDAWMFPLPRLLSKLITPLLSLLSIPFYIYFLNVQRKKHRFFYWTFITLAAVYVFILILILMGMVREAGAVTGLVALFSMPITLAAGIYVYIKGYKPAIYFILAYTALLVGVTVILLYSMGLLPYNDFTANAFSVGSCLQVVLFTLAIADRSNRYKQEALEAQANSLAQAEAHARDLEAKVQDRTLDLKQINEELMASEEEVRQNLEELQATQEVLAQRNHEVEAKEALLRQIFNGVPSMIYQFKLTPDGQMSFPIVSKGSIDVYGLAPEVLMDNAMAVISSIHPDDLPRFQQSVMESAATLKPWHENLRSFVKGEMIWIEGHSVPEKQEDGSVLWSGMVYDITSRKNAESELKSKNEELLASEEELRQNAEELLAINERINEEKQKVDEALKALQEAKNQMVQSEKMASLGQLTAGVAHEINNPVNFIAGGAQGLRLIMNDIVALLDRYTACDRASTEEEKKVFYAQIDAYRKSIGSDEEELKADALAMLSDIEKGADRVTEIVRGLRNFSRADEGLRMPDNLHDNLNNTLLILHSKYKDRIEIVRDFDPKIQSIECFPGQLSQAFMNIISNGIDAIDGKGTITIATKDLGKNVSVSIADSGVGIPEDIQKKIFDPFFTTKSIGKGTGLGLSIVHGIIEKHKGSIKVLSEEGKGTTFMITLPK